MKNFAYELDVDSFLDRYTYSSKDLKFPDLCVLGTVNTETFDNLFWLSQKPGSIDIVVVDDTDRKVKTPIFSIAKICGCPVFFGV